MGNEKDKQLIAEEAQEILRKSGIELPLEQCAAVLEILRMIAYIVVKDHLKRH